MKRVWKWVIGIVLGLLVLAVLVGVAFLVRGNFHALSAETIVKPGWHSRGPMMGPFTGPGFHMRTPVMMGGRRMGLFSGIFKGLFSLGLLALVVMGIIWLARSLRRSKTPVVMPVAAMRACTKCGQSLQEDWKICPYCGKKQ